MATILSWQPIIGLEVHVELKTKVKMFCSCQNDHFAKEPNINVCPVCLGLPGALPVPNKKAIEQTIIIASALNCHINNDFWFDRKNYFYPDLPKAYQISQHFSPIGLNGRLPIETEKGSKEVGISDIHLEEDTAKLIHDNEQSLIDFNRSGVPLVEIVSKPEIWDAKEASAYLKRLQQTIRWLGFSDCDMEKGSMRLEANISVSKDRNKLPNYKVEVKNLNSFKFVEKAINYEIQRQIEILERGETPKQETRGFDSNKGETYSQRSKEVAMDYRYFPEPDIPPFKFSKNEVATLASEIGDLPWLVEKKMADMGIRKSWIPSLSANREIVHQTMGTISLAGDKSLTVEDVTKWIINKKPSLKTRPEKIIENILAEKSKFDLGKDEISQAIEEVIKENPKAKEDFKKGKTQVIGFLIGQVQRKTQGKAEPKTTAKLIRDCLND